MGAGGMDDISPDAVLALDGPTTKFLCPLSANSYGIDFLDFEIKDVDSAKTLFRIQKDPDVQPMPMIEDLDPAVEQQLRTIKYCFPPEFLRYKTVRTSLVFAVGPQEMPNFRMIERHYFRDTLIRSYDFTFGFCIPNSVNSWEAIYPVPELSEDRIQQMIHNDYETTSDSFYFVDNKLVMHNKASYMYKG
mmetsp:Transcript_39800/g.55270  ORF Transcript_39800/g.55270 Transcript_39800/m.55270 type:complete len:190 (+) Transcript_39800:121-690(+)|eukprot:CAMPEP_0196582398 /NCGR_PEP_ID=MMETSP1081-20130531/38784_1 /TAXON_ID=36882 /ORGANISM="Pyramimonas amylifera, Strain CCMP720" /LENGTH=189 /DNA_ID=CAMNT_0041902949 /DNA_START=121 /DNA_END=690 /DNA_ORIENTATION=-